MSWSWVFCFLGFFFFNLFSPLFLDVLTQRILGSGTHLRRGSYPCILCFHRRCQHPGLGEDTDPVGVVTLGPCIITAARFHAELFHVVGHHTLPRPPGPPPQPMSGLQRRYQEIMGAGLSASKGRPWAQRLELSHTGFKERTSGWAFADSLWVLTKNRFAQEQKRWFDGFL